MKSGRVIALLAICLVWVPVATAGPSYTYTTIAHPSAPNNTRVYGINNLGQIVGSYLTSIFTTSSFAPTPNLLPAPTMHGFLLDNGTFTTIEAPTGPDTVVTGINDAGTMVGYQGALSYGISTGFVASNGQFTDVTVGSAVSTLNGISNIGLMVGSWRDTTTTPYTYHGFFTFGPTSPRHTLEYPGALTSGLTGVNNLGAVTGTYANQIGPPVFSFISIGGQFGTTGPDISIYCINDVFVFGGSFTVGGTTHGFVYADGAATLIDVPGATSTIVYGITNAGVVVGTYTDSAGLHGFRATPGP